MAGANAVGAGVAATDHNHVLAFGRNLLGNVVACIGLVLLGQELHGKVNAIQITSGNGQIAWGFRAACEHYGIEFFFQRFRCAYG